MYLGIKDGPSEGMALGIKDGPSVMSCQSSLEAKKQAKASKRLD